MQRDLKSSKVGDYSMIEEITLFMDGSSRGVNWGKNIW